MVIVLVRLFYSSKNYKYYSFESKIICYIYLECVFNLILDKFNKIGKVMGFLTEYFKLFNFRFDFNYNLFIYLIENLFMYIIRLFYY